MVDAFLVRYKIKVLDEVKHSSYLYQKLFRAIYGYTQVVCKQTGKKYVYHRPGVLSKFSYIKEGKNEIIVTKDGFSYLINFFKTGKNPAHNWQSKGNWTASYSVVDVSMDEAKITKAVENQIRSTYVIDNQGNYRLLVDLLEELSLGKHIDKVFLKQYENIINFIKSGSWYDAALKRSGLVKKFDKLVGFYVKYKG
ncbi:MAG: hypothetical protein PHH82_00250 [Candidatus ainarchaeum sp.]|nr:hypothetical protein [Candidatus ainarchaeum sp.]